MRFKNLRIQNFLSVKELSLSLEDRGLVLIKGKNFDNRDCDNNGAGKSTIIEALTYVLYGKTIRGLKGDEVVHNITKKNTKVVLDLEDDKGVSYRIIRYRKHYENKNKSFLYREGKDITPKSEGDVNDFIANLLQADYLTFTSSILYTKESFKFVSATDAEMKQTFDLMLGLDVLTRCQEITKEKLRELEFEIEDLDSEKNKLNTSIKESEEHVYFLQEKEKSFRERVKSEIENTEKLLRDEKKRNSDLCSELESRKKNIELLENSLKDLRLKSENLRESENLASQLKSELLDLRVEHRSLKSDLTEFNSEKSLLKEKGVRVDSEIVKSDKELEDLRVKVQSITNRELRLCPVCGNEIDDNHLEVLQEDYETQIEKLKSEVKSKTSELKSIEKSIKGVDKKIKLKKSEESKILKEIEKFEDMLNFVEEEIKGSGVHEDISRVEIEIKRETKGLFSVESDLKVSNKDIEDYKKSLKENKKILNEHTPYSELICKEESKIRELGESIKTLNESTEELSERRGILEFWKQAYSNQGIKSYILDDITPFLNKRVNKYLSKLTSNRIEVKFNTQTILKNGEKREKFSIEVINSDGGLEYISNSGGEKRRIDIAVNLALQDLVASRSTNKINIAIFDEIFDALDSTGVEKVIELLQEISSEKSTILVISHNEHLQSYFDNTITVVKKDGFSYIEDAD